MEQTIMGGSACSKKGSRHGLFADVMDPQTMLPVTYIPSIQWPKKSLPGFEVRIEEKTLVRQVQ